MRTLLLVTLLLTSASTFAFATTAHYFMRYWNQDSIAAKQRFLSDIGYIDPATYAPLIADPVIARVLDDAIKQTIDAPAIINVLKKFNCVHGARKTEWYPNIRFFIEQHSSEISCDVDKITRMYVITSKAGANLRVAPSVNSRKLNKIKEGRPVVVDYTISNWAFVSSYAGKGFIYLPLLKKY